MAFIGRPNFPESLVALRAQLMANQPDPLAALMSAIGQVGAAGFESAAKTKEDKDKREADIAEATRRADVERENAAMGFYNKTLAELAMSGRLGDALSAAMGAPTPGQVPASLSAMGVGAPSGPMSVPGVSSGGFDTAQLAQMLGVRVPGAPRAILPPTPKTAAPKVETEQDKALKAARLRQAEAGAAKAEKEAAAPKEQTAAEKAKSAEAAKVGALARSGIAAIGDIRAIINAPENQGIFSPKNIAGGFGADILTKIPGLGGATSQILNDKIQESGDAIARLRTGAAISAVEEKRYNNLLRGRFKTMAAYNESLDMVERFLAQVDADLQTGKRSLNGKPAPGKPEAVTAAPSGLTAEQRAARIAELEKKAGKK